MNSYLQGNLANAAFFPPNCDGSFDPDFEDYLQLLGSTRPSIILAFAPKAAGTYLRSAAITAVDGQLVRTVHAQGGRDASFYLPTFLIYYAKNFPARTLVTHVHMQALPANRHFIDALDLKPVIMLRAIPDMLASYLDMLEASPLSADNWLNIRVPENYPFLDGAAKADFIIDMMAPWYVSYFSTWLDYARESDRVLILDYDEFRTGPETTLMKLVAHSGLPRSREECRQALEATWADRSELRFNKGVSGRGQARFNPAQLERLEKQIDFYPNLAGIKAKLIPPSVS